MALARKVVAHKRVQRKISEMRNREENVRLEIEIEGHFQRHWTRINWDSQAFWGNAYDCYTTSKAPRLGSDAGVRGGLLISWRNVHEMRERLAAHKVERCQVSYVPLVRMALGSDRDARECVKRYDPETEVVFSLWCQDPNIIQTRIISRSARDVLVAALADEKAAIPSRQRIVPHSIVYRSNIPDAESTSDTTTTTHIPPSQLPSNETITQGTSTDQSFAFPLTRSTSGSLSQHISETAASSPPSSSPPTSTLPSSNADVPQETSPAPASSDTPDIGVITGLKRRVKPIADRKSAHLDKLPAIQTDVRLKCALPTCISSVTRLLLCARCATAKYCSAACQKLHWCVHKRICRAYASKSEETITPLRKEAPRTSLEPFPTSANNVPCATDIFDLRPR
jgi:hypothetical protein